MTFAEIYSSVCKHLWGNSNPPASASIMLQGAEGIIADCHQKIQRDYNYWFMQAYAIIDTADGQYGYFLPDDFKEMINCLFKMDGSENFAEPLEPLGLGEGQLKWEDSEAEYPEYYEIADNSIILYPKPSEIRSLHINYWKMFQRPSLDSSSDPVTENLYKAIVYMAITEYADIQKEFDISDRYTQKLYEELELFKKQDRAKRQNHISSVLYRGV